MTLPRLSDATLDQARPGVRRPAYDRAKLGVGIVHIGVGGFHRGHQAVFTEDAVEARGGDWGVCGVALQRPVMPDTLTAQDGLYTLEILQAEPTYRIVGVMKEALFAARDSGAVLARMAAPLTHVVTLTVTEKGYALDGRGELDFEHPDVRADVERPALPRSTAGWLVAGLGRRMREGSGPLTVLSCDNVSKNGEKLGRAVRALAEAVDPDLVAWIDDNTAFPNGMVDSITPAGLTDAAMARIAAATGLDDRAPVLREPFAQWVIEDRFAGPRPAWDTVGVELVSDVTPHERLKLHGLNATHSALAYLGLPKGLSYVREAIADLEIAAFVEAMVMDEIAPALAPLDVPAYWAKVKARYANPMINFPLTQIAEDGSVKLGQRILPLIVDAARAGRRTPRLAAVVRAWLAFTATAPVKDPAADRLRALGGRVGAALDDPDLFPLPFRNEPAVRAAMETPP